MEKEKFVDCYNFRRGVIDCRHIIRLLLEEKKRFVCISNGEMIRLSRLDGIINDVKHIKSLCFKNRYCKILAFDDMYYYGKWCDIIQYLDKGSLNRAHIQTSYSFHIDFPEKVDVAYLESISYNSGFAKSMVEKINTQIEVFIKNHLVKHLNETGYENTLNNIIKISEMIEKDINHKVLKPQGISIINLDILIEKNKERNQTKKQINDSQKDEEIDSDK